MGLSIQEQLLNAGLVDKKQVKKADHEKRLKKTRKKKGQDRSDQDTKARLRQQQAERAKQDQELNAERNRQAQQKADLAAAQQLIAANRSPLEEGDIVYHYVDGGQIKRISVDQKIADQLSDGRMGLALYHDDFVLIPAETVSKVLQRDEASILAYNDPAESEDEYPSDW